MKQLNLLILVVIILISLLATGCTIKTKIENHSPTQKETNQIIVQTNTELTIQEKDTLKFNLLSQVASNNLNEDSSDDIYKLIENANLDDLNDILTIINNYCELNISTDKCQNIRNKLKERADFLKEKRFEEIKKDKDNLVSNLISFQALLKAQRSATNVDTLFSTENVKKINRETKKLMKERFEKIIEEGSLEDLYNELILVLANTPASCGTSEETPINPDGFGLYGNDICNYKNKIIKKAREILVNILAKKDVCNLSEKEITNIKKSIPNCNTLINDDDFCTKLNNGNIEGAFNRLLKIYPTSYIQINCNQNTTTTNQTELNETVHNQSINETTLYEETNTPVVEVSYYDDITVGWGFEIVSGEVTKNDVNDCIINCAFEPPLEIISEDPPTCFDYITQMEAPCDHRPMIPLDVQDCTQNCLEEIAME